MKKLLALLLAAAIMLSSSALAADIDWAGISDDELLRILTEARLEMVRRAMIGAEDPVMFDTNGILATFTGVEKDWSYEIHFDLVNSSSRKISLSVESVYINGWNATALAAYIVDPGKQARLSISLFDAGNECKLTSVDDIETIEVHFNIYSVDTYSVIAKDLVFSCVVK